MAETHPAQWVTSITSRHGFLFRKLWFRTIIYITNPLQLKVDLGTHAIVMTTTGEKLQEPSKNTNDVLTYIEYKRHLYNCISGLKKSYKHGTRIIYIPILQ